MLFSAVLANRYVIKYFLDTRLVSQTEPDNVVSKSALYEMADQVDKEALWDLLTLTLHQSQSSCIRFFIILWHAAVQSVVHVAMVPVLVCVFIDLVFY